MRPGHPFRTWLRRLGVDRPTPPPAAQRVRLTVTRLEDRTVPSNAPFELPRPMAPLILNSVATDAAGDGVILYNAQGGTYSVFAQRIDAQGNLVGDPIQVNTPSGGDAIAAGVAEGPDGSVVAVYIGQGPDYDGAGIYFRQINADGTLPQTSETFVGPSNFEGYGPALLMPSVAIDPDDNFAIASAENGLQLFSWDLSSVSQPVQYDPNVPGAYSPQISIATSGTLVETYAAGDPTWTAAPQYAQQFTYAPDGNGGFAITPLGNAVSVGAALASVPVAEPDGSFVAVTGGPNFFWSAGEGGTIYEQHFAADGTPIDQNPVQVSPDVSTGTFLAGAGLDASGNLYIGWYSGDIWNSMMGDDTPPNLYAQKIQPDGTTWTSPLRITPSAATMGYASWAAGSIAAAPDGSLLAGWTDYDPASGNLAVEARHYDPILYVDTKTVTWSGGNYQGDYTHQYVTVTSQATGFEDHILWEYWVKNVNYVGRLGGLGTFTLIDDMVGNSTDMSNDLGWTLEGKESVGVDVNEWAAGSSALYLYPGQEGHFTFTTAVVGIDNCFASANDDDSQDYDGLSPAEADMEPLAPGPDPFTIGIPKYVPVNANNDNYDPNNLDEPRWEWDNGAEQVGIPACRDFNATHLWQADPQLMQASISWPNGRVSATVSGGTGELDYWKDQFKNDELSLADLQNNLANLQNNNDRTATFYIEGVHESIRRDDFTFNVKWVSQSGITEVKEQKVTITPLVNSYTATPGGGAPGPNVYFSWTYGQMVNRPPANPPTAQAGWLGMKAGGLKLDANGIYRQTAGILFRANVTTGGTVDMNYVQNVTAKTNGLNGFQGAGWTFTGDDPNHPPAYNNAHIPGTPTYPRYLDGPENATTPLYSAQPFPTTDPDSSDYRTNDNPQTGTPPVAQADLSYTNIIDVTTNYRMYLAASYSDGSIYPVAYLDWTFNAWGTSPVFPLGPTVNGDPQGVRADAAVRSNQNPWTALPVFTQCYGWLPTP